MRKLSMWTGGGGGGEVGGDEWGKGRGKASPNCGDRDSLLATRTERSSHAMCTDLILCFVLSRRILTHLSSSFLSKETQHGVSSQRGDNEGNSNPGFVLDCRKTWHENTRSRTERQCKITAHNKNTRQSNTTRQVKTKATTKTKTKKTKTTKTKTRTKDEYKDKDRTRQRQRPRHKNTDTDTNTGKNNDKHDSQSKNWSNNWSWLVN